MMQARSARASLALTLMLTLMLTLALALGASPLHAAGLHPDRVTELTVGDGGGFNADLLPDVVLGPPRGGGLFAGSNDVVSLGRGGSITLAFTEAAIVDGPGPDLIVFENAFLTAAGTLTGTPFAEPATVAVSANGVDFVAFPCDMADADGFFPGCAGIFPVFANADDPSAPDPAMPTGVGIGALVGVPISTPPPAGAGGDAFDLAQIGMASARFVRIVSGPGALPAFEGKAGFDLDAIIALNWQLATGDDADDDGVPDAVDTCPTVPDPEQRDGDGDGRGDLCDSCPDISDAPHSDRDGDGRGDACDPCPDDPEPSHDDPSRCEASPADADGDGVPDADDVCPAVPDSGQGDQDGDGHGDACDGCPEIADDPTQDRDGDGRGDACDSCPDDPDPTAEDTDGDTIGDACDPCPDDGSCGPAVIGAFAGGGRGREDDSLLTFITPTGARVEVPANALGGDLWITFAREIDPESFRAKIRGKDVRALFAPVVPGSTRRLTVPIVRKRTRLVLRAKSAPGTSPRRKDVDRIVFRRARR